MEVSGKLARGAQTSNTIFTQELISMVNERQTAASEKTCNATVPSRSCIIIGSTTLAIYCTEQVLAAGHEVRAIVAMDDVFRTWATREGIRNEESLTELEVELAEQPIDWLFSVVNPAILSSSLIDRVLKGAFNYHDSPLPRYAGSHATSWALIAQEAQYAVSWHTVTTVVDAGQIVIQEPVSIESRDTALSLNLKCFQAARKGFRELLLQLEQDNISMVHQDRTRRTFYRRTRRPKAGACLDWTQSAEALSAIVRALDFGELYPNPLTVTKLILPSDVVQVNELRFIEQRSETTPGTLISIGPEGWCVSTSSNDVRISNFVTLRGNPIEPERLAHNSMLQPGMELPKLTVEQGQKIKETLEDLAPYEEFWHDRLALIQPIQLPYERLPKQNVPQWEIVGWCEPLHCRYASTPRLTVLGAFGIYLARLTGQSRLQIGLNIPVTTSNPFPIPTLLASTVPMECEVDWESSFTDSIGRIVKELENIYQKRTYPRDLVSRYPALRAIPELINSEPWRIAIEMVDNSAQDKAIGSLLTLQINSLGRFRWIYDARCLEKDVINRISVHLRELSRAAADIGDTPVARLNLLPKLERELLLNTWNDTQRRYPDKSCVHQLFEQQVECSPDAIAIEFEDERIRYVQLNVRANQLAHKLVELGVKPGNYVATLLERSIELVAAELAILKVGAAYVPLDPIAPYERHRWIINDCSASLLITHVQFTTFNVPVLELKKINLDEMAVPNPHLSGSGRNIAYVMYTSGSTGTPKGVLVPHRGIIQLIVNNDYAEVGPDARVAFTANPAFDASTVEMWGPLLGGGTLVIVDRETVLNSQDFCQFLQREKINILVMTTGHFNQTITELIDVFPQLDIMLVAGDTLDTRVINAIPSNKRPKHFINGYGPTESTALATTFTVGEIIDEKYSVIPIGRPIANKRIYLLDMHGELVPCGAIGEIYIGGAGIACGYLNRPNLTAERFIPDPHTNNPNARMYKTGDLARYLPDGNLVFHGRNDHQVKIRGFRIEPGEIEAKLAEHPAVRQAVVIAFGEGHKRLVAYVVANTEISVKDLREYLAHCLPDYMVPAAFVQLDRLPLTLNGKVNRQVLPAPNLKAFTHDQFEAPIGPLENSLAEIWRALLGVSQVSRYDSFFALGGHSLLAVQLSTQIASLGVDLPLATVFSSPTLVALATAIQTRLDTGSPVHPLITRIARQGTLPISFAQQRLWFLSQLDDISQAYHIPFALQLKGLLDVRALKQALDTLWTRHEALRSVFESVDGQPEVRLLDAQLGLPLHQIDLNRVTELDTLYAEEVRYPFNLVSGPLIRALLIRVTNNMHVLLLTQHHIVSDGWSLNVLLNELSSLYNAHRNQELNPLLPLSIQYPDYAMWQRQWLVGTLLQQQRDYWKANLANAPVWLDIPTDRPRPAKQSFAGESVRIQLDSKLTLDLKLLSRQQDVTVFMVLLAAWAAVLSRLSGQEEVVIGVPNANRVQKDIEFLIGFFVNTLAIRVDLRNQPNMMELLARIKIATVQGQAHQDLPFEQVVDIVKPPRRLDCTPVCQVMFAWQNNQKRNWVWPDLDVTVVECPYNKVKFDLELNLAEVNDQIVGELRYATALFNKNTIERQANYLETTLRAMTTNTHVMVSRINILDTSERELLLKKWNNTQIPYPDEACIHHLFEQQVEQTPNVTATRFAEKKLSYAELNAQANRLAHLLIEVGVVAGNNVVILLDRSTELIIAQLAILKAGAAYVPLDPQTPAVRHAAIIDDCSACLLITDARDANLDIPKLKLKELNLEEMSPQNLCLPRSNLEVACIMYTSGSTGNPKGVLVVHRGIARLIKNDSYVRIRPNDRIAFIANPTFDASTFEIWGALLNGATVVVLDRETVVNLNSFCSVLQKERINILSVTAGFFDQIMADYADVFPTLDTLIIGGDVLNPRSINALLTNASPKYLINAYGPTETTIVATTYQISGVCDEHSTIPIGRPVSNTRIYLLNSFGQPVPLGSVGEVYIGGAGVARGYLNHPDRTAKYFLFDPFAGTPDAKMYRTGDLARYLDDGNLIFLGRNDNQIKIRGFRIEPGEIEARLVEHPTVREAVVVVVGDSDKLLIAYFIGDPIEPAELRKYLSAYLPDYMVPAAFVQLDAFPLTSNGKLDRQALPLPDINALARAIYEAPTGPIEIAVAEIWRDLLGINEISRHDSFFALGGHSLLAIRMSSRITSLGVQLPLGTIFASPTLAVLAAAIDSFQKTSAATCPSIISTDRDSTLPLSFSQQRLWFLAHHGGAGDAYHIPLVARLEGKLDIRALQQALDSLWIRHEALRSVFVTINSEPEVHLLEAKQGLPLRLIYLKDATELTTLCAEEAHLPFDLSCGPLIRTVLIRMSDDLHTLVVTQHHIVSDGWSIGVLMLELEQLYRAHLNNQPNTLPPLVVQYPDYAIWQRKWLSDERLREHTDYWKKTLANSPVLLNLRTDRPRPTQQSFVGNSVSIELDSQLTLSLKRLSHQHGVTLFTPLLTAWAAVLCRLSGQDEIVIGVPSANRRQPEIESLIGFFVNTLALRIDLRDRPNVAKLLRRVSEITNEAQSHQDLPFEEVVEIVQPPRRLDHTPVFQVTFAWETNAKQQWSWPHLDVSLVKSVHDVVKYDLELNLAETNDRIIGTLAYAVALFDKKTIMRQTGYLEKMLKTMAKNAQANLSIAKIDILGSSERELLLKEWNSTEIAYSDRTCIHQLFEHRVELAPNATAVVFENSILSYGELNARANQLAHLLIERNMEPEERVAICVERSPMMIIGFLAILKAGAAYVPLDPTYGSKRLMHILTDADPVIVLADSTGRRILGEAILATRYVLDPSHHISTNCSNKNPIVARLNSRHLAYVIYTSGSTGRPKGVMVEHRSLVNLAYDQIARFGVRTSSRILQFASFCFDASIFEILMALSSGASLYLVPGIERQDQNRLFSYVQKHAITHATLPPVILQSWKDKLRQVNSLTIILAGETPNAALLLELQDKNTVFNAYGLTESTVCASVWPCPAKYTGKTIPIGRPISNAKIYLLDAYYRLVPLGAEGELHIGGDAVARGYLNRSDLTSEYFVHDPFAKDPNARMYKTGDLASYLPDGNLVFLGRNDQQVKIRGFRIELGEIEIRLVEHPSVHQAVVIAVGEPDKRLVAYVVSDEIKPVVLREYLSTHLPDFMIPAVIIRIEKIPITSNGKLDRGALPRPDNNAFSYAAYETPIGPIEAILADVWRDLLDVERVGRYDSFFALGGHSLLAVQMIERLRRHGLGLSVRDLFQTPILATLSRALKKRHELPVPRNQITRGTTNITPELLPLIDLTQNDIDRIVACVPGGITNLQDIYALSPLQEGILFHHILNTESDPYLLVSEMAFPERNILNRYLAAVQRVIDRHDILRTAFIWKGISVPAQVVWRNATLSITELTFASNDEPISLQLTKRFDSQHFRMNLSEAPLLRFVITHDKTSDRWILLTLLHHLIGDHTTIDIMHMEVQAFFDGRGDTLSASQPFRRVIAQTRLGTSPEEHERFFKDMLADVFEPTLPFCLTDVHQDGSQVSETHQMLSTEVNQKLRIQAKRLNVSLASLCHVAWAQVLSLTSGQMHVVFGTVLFGRMQSGEGADRAMGLFINTLPIRVDLGRTNIVESVRNTHIRLAGLLEHEHASLMLAQRCSGVPAGAPLLSALLNYRHIAASMNTNNNVIDHGIEFLGAKERTNYPFTLSVEDFGVALGMTVQTQSPIEPQRVAGYMEQALISLAEALEYTPFVPVHKLQIIPESERELLLKTWNDTQTSYADQLCIHQLFQRQVTCTPSDIAILFQEEMLSYAHVNDRANKLGYQLRNLNVGPDMLVAICVDRSPGMVVGLLAILKAGAAYVPLDPSHPKERLMNILTDANPTVVLADMAGRKALGKTVFGRITLDPNTELTGPTANLLVPNLTSTHLAYVMYTSGSTGMPKGVQIEHRAVINRLEWMQQVMPLISNDRVLLKTPFTFDVSVWEIFWTLLNGATLVIAVPGDHQDPNALAALISEKNVTTVHFVPSMLSSFLNSNRIKECHNLQRLICSGETLSAASIHLCRDRLPSVELFNLYGPTEATIDVTSWKCPAYYSYNYVPIGRPISNTRIYLLNQWGQPVPLGAVGELCIGGVGVARGYLNRPDLTNKLFVPDPFVGNKTTRLYKTGDLARYLPDGNLLFLGRNDKQVKVRGVRIETGEIESALAKHPAVRETIVVIDEKLDKRLIAYVVADEFIPSALREFLSAYLPDNMLPSAFMRLDALPRMPNGKLDYRSLPSLDTHAFARAIYEAPISQTETILMEIWRELIGVEHVSRHDSFFALGGHSLLAVQMIDHLRRRNLSLSIRDLFQFPVLETLARTLTKHNETPAPLNRITQETDIITPELLPLIDLAQSDIERIVACVPGGIRNIQDIYALSPLQDGILFHHMLHGDSDPYLLTSQSAFTERKALTSYLAAIQQVVNRHDILRTAVVWKDISVPAQVVWRNATITITELTLDPKDGTISTQLNKRCDPRHFRMNSCQAPLLRFVFTHDKDNDRWILLTLLHHLIGDHTTLDIMHREVQAFLEGRGDTLPPAEPFRNLIAQAQLGISAEMHESFFKKMLADVTEPTLPFGLADVRCDGSQIRETHHMLPAELGEKLRAQAKRINVSLASLCHVAWAQILSLASSQAHVVFGTVLFGRMQSGHRSDRAMGLFINTLPIRVNLDDTSVMDSVRSTHIRLADLLEHEQASLALVQRCSGVPAGTPLFSALLNYRHNVTPTYISSTNIKILEVQERTNYPLTVSVEDSGQALGITVQVQSPIQPERVCKYMHEALINLAEALEHTANMPIRQLQILPAAERKLLLETWNDTQTSYSDQACIHHLFEEQVKRTPNNIAILFGNEDLSYVQLNSRANKLAHKLSELSVMLDARVAICMEQSPAMIVSIVAVLKSGAHYVPLDPKYSDERLAHILSDANPIVVLADVAGKKALGNALLLHTVVNPNEEFVQSETNLQVPDLTARHLAYVIYTSGSTGVPKGVMIEHRSIVNYASYAVEHYGILHGEGSVFVSSFAFDLCLTALFPVLICGRSVRLPSNNVDAAWRQTILECNNLSPVKLTPSHLTMFQELLTVETLDKHIDALVLGGEALNSAVLEGWYEYAPMTRIFNEYGPTETTVGCTVYEIEPSRMEKEFIPIGRPIANARIYLLNAHNQPVPLGAIGELCIGGHGVARGYLNRPDLTAQRFLQDPFVKGSDARIYKTGDLARYLSDGTLVFLGRNDDQIKIRGFRIELGEIQNTLMNHPAVHETVVLAFGDSHKCLIAYVVADQIEPVALREYLRARLPEYMLPNAFIRLDAIPLTPNGKLDRDALPMPNANALDHAAYEAPIGPIENILAEIWREILGVNKISRHDSFFALGGHSLLAVKMIHRAASCGLPCSLNELFEAPLLATFATRLTPSSLSKSYTQAIPVRPIGTELPLFFVPTGLGDHSYVFSLTRHIHVKYPVYALPWPSIGESSPCTIETLTEKMISFIKRVQPKGPYRIAGYSAGGILAYAIAQSFLGHGDTVAFVGLIDVSPPHVLRELSAEHLFSEYLAQNTNPGIYDNIVDARKQFNKIDFHNLASSVEQVDLTGTNLSYEFVVLAWKRINFFTQAASSFEPLSLPITIYQFHSTEEYYPRSWIQENYKNLLDIDMTTEWNKILRPHAVVHSIPIPGNHWTMMSDVQNRIYLVEALTQALETLFV